MSQPNSPNDNLLDDPAKRARVVRVLLVATPFMFVGCYLLAAIQGAAAFYALVIALAGAGMSLGAALAIGLLGSNAKWALVAVQIVLVMLSALKR